MQEKTSGPNPIGKVLVFLSRRGKIAEVHRAKMAHVQVIRVLGRDLELGFCPPTPTHVTLRAGRQVLLFIVLAAECFWHVHHFRR